MNTKDFCKRWTAMLWQAMGASGKGYKRDSLRHTGRGDDRRGDKLTEFNEDGSVAAYPVPKLLRRYRAKYS